MVVEFETSGMSRVAFCQEHRLALSTLARYQRRRQQERNEDGGSNRWVAVELSPAHSAASGLTVVLASGRRIEVGRGFDVKTLEQLVRLLEPA